MSAVANPWNPSATDVREWAYAKGLTEPCQDWDLALSAARPESTYLEIVADRTCRKRKFFRIPGPLNIIVLGAFAKSMKKVFEVQVQFEKNK